MTQEDKKLVLQDLSGRLMYRVKIQCPDLFCPSTMIIEELIAIDRDCINDNGISVEYVKPYLRPISSMTDEEYKIYHELITGMFETGVLNNFEILLDFFNSHHFDFRSLIKKRFSFGST